MATENLKPQVDAKKAYGRKYLSLIRSITHWYQAEEVADATPPTGSVLEIGPGSGHTTWILKMWGYQVTTLDFDPKVSPTVAGDVTRLPFADNSFDTVLAAEVLEHLPFDMFETSLRELARVTRQSVVLTLPAPFAGISSLLNLPLLKPLGIRFGFPLWLKHKFDGEHYWELGKRNHEVGRIRKCIANSGLSINREYRPPATRYCYFFSLHK